MSIIRSTLQFARKIQRGLQKTFYGEKYMENIFTNFYRSNHWTDSESVSGTGSNLGQTAKIRQELPNLLSKYKIESMLDIPCGDFFWMKEVELRISYIGADIVTDLILENQKKYGSPKRKFLKLDITKNKLPKVDLIMCRDLFVHFSFEDIFRAIENIKRSNITYLLTTHFPETKNNSSIVTGQWRPLNLEMQPLNFPSPLESINEGTTQDNGKYPDKSLALWKLSDI